MPAMGTLDDSGWRGKYGTDVSAYRAVQAAVTRLVRKQWVGWSSSDREDLEQLVMVKYFNAFGREPNGSDGIPAVPIAWLMKVIRNAGVDFHRQRQARPADPVDFQGSDAFGLERLAQAVNPQPSLASAVARQVDLQRILEALGDAYPADARLVVSRFVMDRDIESIAADLGKSPDATKKAIQRAVRRMRDLMALTSESSN